MSEIAALYLTNLAAVAAMMLGAWLLSLAKKDAGIVDVFWGLGFVLIAWVTFFQSNGYLGRRLLLVALVTAWGLRLAGYILWRNWGRPEDYRYGEMRKKRGASFWWKSLYVVFGLQGVLAWIVAAPLLPAMTAGSALGVLDYAAVALWLVGFIFEAVGDFQLSRFKADPESRGRVLNTGLWRYTRHPNYFGEFCIWWAFWLFAASAGAWWTIYAPALMSFLLLRVSGVAMLEKDIGERRPAYAEYIRNTNAFFPGTPRAGRKEVKNA